MSKFRFRSYLDHALFVILIMAGAAASAVLDVRAVSGAMAAGKLGTGAGVAAVPAPAKPPVAASVPPRARPPVAAASAAHSALAGTVVAELTL